MNEQFAIQKRVSRRKYEDQCLSAAHQSLIKQKITTYNHESGLSIQLIEDGSIAFNGLAKSYGMFKGVRSLIILKGATSDVHLLEKTGYYGELLVLYATTLGLGTCWVAGTFDRKNPIFKCDADEQITCVITIGTTPDTLSKGESFIRGLTHRKSKPAEAFYTVIDKNITLPKWFHEGIEAVMLAPSAVNSQPVHFSVTRSDDESALQVQASVHGKRTTDKIDLGIAKCHFEIAAGGSFTLGNPGTFYKEHTEN